MKTKWEINAGHGGRDSGATGSGMLEKDINLDVALRIGKILREHGIRVTYTRTTDVFVPLAEIARRANVNGVDGFVSIHANNHSDINVKGIEAYHYPSSVQGKLLSQDIIEAMVKDKVYTRNRGVKSANFAVLRRTNMPASLVELGFMRNKEDALILKNRRQDLAVAVAKGILKYSGIKYVKNPTKKKPVISEWAKSGYEYVTKNNISDGTRPTEHITRQEVWTMLERLSGNK